MKKTLKESVRDIRNMIGRIDHPVISEGPGDEGEIGGDDVEKGITLPSTKFVNIDKQGWTLIDKYAPTNKTAAELQNQLNSQGIKSINDVKAGDLVSLFKKNKVPFSLYTTTGKDLKANLNLGGNKNITFGIKGAVKTDYNKIKDITLQGSVKFKLPVKKKTKGTIV